MVLKAKTVIGNIDIFCNHDEIVKTEKLIPHPRNPNTHPEKQVELLARIIEAQGWRAPITVSKRSGFVIRGHGRLLAAEKLKMESVPVEYQVYENEAQEWADLIADNKIAELSKMDNKLLEEFKAELADMDFDVQLAALSADDLTPKDAGEGAYDKLKGDKKDFEQMTFVLHVDQLDAVTRALEAAKKLGPFDEKINENSNGNALARVCELFIPVAEKEMKKNE